MADFEYQGIDRTGKKVSGSVSSGNEGEVRMMLRGQGVRPTRIAKKRALNTDLKSLLSGGSPSLDLKSRIIFTRQLQVMIGSGIPLIQGLEILSDQTSDPNLKRILAVVKDRVSQGSFFWETLAAYPKAFSKIYVALIRAGESSGSLDTVLKRLTRYLEDSERLRRMVKGALIYPAAVTSVGVLVVWAMLTFVIPKFEQMLANTKEGLPLPTQLVINASHFLGDNMWQILIGAGVVAFLLIRFLQTPEGRAARDRLLYRLPLFGDLIQKSGVAAFSRTLQTLLAAGVNLIDAIEIARTTADNVVLENEIVKIRPEIESGKTLGMVVSKMTVFPRMAVQMIGVGEATGNLDKMLEKVADFYEAEIESVVSNIGKMIEPLILVVLGGAVAGMMVAMYLPMFKMAGGVE